MSFAELFNNRDRNYTPGPAAPVPLTYNHETSQWMNPETGFPGSLDQYAEQMRAYLNYTQPPNPATQGFNFPVGAPQQAQTPFANMLAPMAAPPQINFQQPQAMPQFMPQAMPPQQIAMAGLPAAMQQAIPAYLRGGV